MQMKLIKISTEINDSVSNVRNIFMKCNLQNGFFLKAQS